MMLDSKQKAVRQEKHIQFLTLKYNTVFGGIVPLRKGDYAKYETTTDKNSIF